MYYGFFLIREISFLNYNSDMDKNLHKKGKISNLELALILFITACLVFIGIKGLGWYYKSGAVENDQMLVNTAESAARIDSSNGFDCPVRSCKKGVYCTHHYGVDGYIGYFDHETNSIVGTKPAGYNESSKMKADGKIYKGEPGTMVIQVVCHEGQIDISWVKGKEKK